MNIVILGAGQVGSSLAELLSDDNNDVTLVDLDRYRLQQLQDRLDIRTVYGHASHPSVLRQAGLETADILIAATQHDETNICACQTAHFLFKTETKIARIRSKDYFEAKELFNLEEHEEDIEDAFAIDLMISPETLVTDSIMQLIQYPGSLQVIDFADQKVQLVALKTRQGGPLVGKKIHEIKNFFPADINFRIVAIYRQDEVVLPNGDATINIGDEVFFLAEPEDISRITNEFIRSKQKKVRNIMIAGGGNIGFELARQLENAKQFQGKIIEQNLSRAREIAEVLDNTIIIHGDVADRELLLEENIDETDLFIAVTNKDEANIISSMMAKKLGVKRVIALVNNQSYTELIHLNSIDIALSADRITTNNLLHYMRKGKTIKASTLRRGTAEAMEIVVHGTPATSKIIGRQLCEIEWPNGVTIGCIIRAEKVIFAHRDLELAEDDHVILFASDRTKINQITSLFSPGNNQIWF